MAKIDQRLVELLKAYGEDNTSVWDCHGTWVAYHAAIERMAARAGIIFDGPQMIVNDPEKKTVVISVSARMGDKHEWSFGEVSPSNNKNAYPYAMAEKRAKDRVALKLLGMSGLAYSEEEADDFKASKPAPVEAEKAGEGKSEPKPVSSAATKRHLETIDQELIDCRTPNDVKKLLNAWADTAESEKWSKDYWDEARRRFARRKAELERASDTVDAIQEQFPGASVTDERITNEHGRELHPLEAAE